jgi:hypothetical protein
MAQQDTPAAGSGLSKNPARTDHIYPILYVQACKHLDILEKLHTKHCQRKRANSAEIAAIWMGTNALESESRKLLYEAQRDGKLLMCWDGSTVVNIPREVAA